MKIRGSQTITKDLILPRTGASTPLVGRVAYTDANGLIIWKDVHIVDVEARIYPEKNSLVFSGASIYYSLIINADGAAIADPAKWKELGSGGGAGVQSDWDELDSGVEAFILNKPDLSQFLLRSETLSEVTVNNLIITEADIIGLLPPTFKEINANYNTILADNGTYITVRLREDEVQEILTEITLDSTGLPIGYSQSILNMSFLDVIIKGSDTIEGDNIPVPYMYQADYVLKDTGVWGLSINSAGGVNSMVWKGRWKVQRDKYKLNEVVKDSGTSMIVINPEGTTDRPSPQTSTDPRYFIDPTESLTDLQDVSVVKIKYTITTHTTGYIQALDIYSPAWNILTSASRITILNTSTGIANTPILNTALVSGEWTTVEVNPFFTESGVTYEISYEAYNVTSRSNDITGNWKFISGVAGAALAYVNISINNIPSPAIATVKISHTDLDSVDRTVELRATAVDSIVEIYEVGDTYRHLLLKVSTVNTASGSQVELICDVLSSGGEFRTDRECFINIHTPLTLPTDYGILTNYFVANPVPWASISSRLFFDGIIQGGNASGYGINILFQNAITSPDWETLVDVPGVSTSPGFIGKFIDGADPLDAVYMLENVGVGKQPEAGHKLDINGLVAGEYFKITSNNGNTKYGKDGLEALASGADNTAIGYKSLQSILTGDNNTSLGSKNLQDNTSGSDNIAIGVFALRENTIGSSNIAIGGQVMENALDGESNIGIGHLSQREGGGTGNVSIGGVSLRYNTGSYNTALGDWALAHTYTKNNNVGIGTSAGAYITGGVTINVSEHSIYLGYKTKALATGATNEVVIGYDATGKGSNTTYIGNASTTDTYLEGDVRAENSTIAGINSIGGKAIITKEYLGRVELEIGDWNMSLNGDNIISHGLSATEWKTVRNVKITIRNDADTLYRDGLMELAIDYDNTNFIILQHSSYQPIGFGGNYSSTSYNRGWITYTYTKD